MQCDNEGQVVLHLITHLSQRASRRSSHGRQWYFIIFHEFMSYLGTLIIQNHGNQKIASFQNRLACNEGNDNNLEDITPCNLPYKPSL